MRNMSIVAVWLMQSLPMTCLVNSQDVICICESVFLLVVYMVRDVCCFLLVFTLRPVSIGLFGCRMGGGGGIFFLPKVSRTVNIYLDFLAYF